MRVLGLFTSKGDTVFRRGDKVILRSNRGLEIGEILIEATDHVIGQMNDPLFGTLVRGLSDEDRIEMDRLLGKRPEMFRICQQHIDQLQIEMKLVDLEQMFGGERVVIYYLAEDRVDFRDLVKLLAADFQTRIEMRQIGVRDEAKLLADYGDCGKPVCCNTHLSEMPPVSMRMAKLQKATLDPNKISGRCGRLKCCLRYEYETYDSGQKNLPQVGAEIVLESGKARVLGQEILTQQVLVETEDHRRILVDAQEILVVSKKTAKRKKKSD
jgi:cell fate regulator YaaT (PSP1 superfamily)